MSKIKIEKGIAIPSSKHRGFYPWKEMKVGDSFFIKKKNTWIFSAAYQFGQRQSPKWRFTCRSVDGGVRVWRIE